MDSPHVALQDVVMLLNPFVELDTTCAAEWRSGGMLIVGGF